MAKTPRGDILDKRHAILHAARELFATQGYDDTTIAQIARSASVAVGTVYLYFANKRAIRLEAGLELDANMAQVIRSHMLLSVPFREALRQIVEATFRGAREHMRLLTYSQVEAQSPAEAERLRASRQGLVDALESYFHKAIAQGKMTPFATAVYAELLIDFVSAIVWQCFAVERGEREAFYSEGVIDLIERLFFGPPLAAGKQGSAAFSEDAISR